MEQNLVINEIKSGNKQTLENIYTMYRRGFIEWTTATYRISTDQALDLYQQTILAFYENILSGKLNGVKSSIKTYLYAIGKNKVYELYRYHGRIRNISSTTPDYEEISGDDPEYNERLLELSKVCLNKLGDPCRQILESYYYHKKSMQEIATWLGYKNEQTAKNQKYKCLLRLREVFRQEAQKQKEYIYG
ncbi:MAG: sigma-70 family RNA polymerase sigma factor [Bacteroidia bacterium]|nr:sigma-70 family RNA polymerase sigma factor [Bacteroidia bacterium]